MAQAAPASSDGAGGFPCRRDDLHARNDSDRTDSRMTAIEVRMSASDQRMDASDRRSDKFGADIDNFKVLLGDIRSDVSFIRGKLESRGK